MVESVLTLPHAHPFEALLNEPFTGTLDVSTIKQSSQGHLVFQCNPDESPRL
jgi:hypothetical protein